MAREVDQAADARKAKPRKGNKRRRAVKKSAPPSQGAPMGVAAKRYETMVVDREPFLVRARRSSLLTVPSLFREMGADGTSETPAAWQSFGAYCVAILSSKLALTMFPPGVSFIKLSPSKKTEEELEAMEEGDRGELRTQISKGLQKTEKQFTDAVDEDGDHDRLVVALRHLTVGGNHGLQMYKDGLMRGIPFTNWVCLRDKAGNLLEFVIKDTMVYETLAEPVKELVRSKGYKEPDPKKDPDKRHQDIDVYTRGYLRDGSFYVCQECWGEVIPGSEWTYNTDALPYIFIPFNLLDGESYGRGYCEEFEGDLQTLDGLEQTVTEGSASAAMYIRLVKPGGVTNKNALAQARNGDVITGNVDDVGVLEANKNADWQTALNRIQAKEERLGKAFLLNSTVQRSAERVTAEEIRFVAQELQDQLGGVYTSQVKWFQRPYVLLKMAALQRNRRMTYLPKGTTSAKLTTGAAALGRNAELTQLDALVSVPEAMAQAVPATINPSIYMQRRAVALGVDQEGLVKTDKQLQAEQEAQVQQGMAQTMGPEVIKAGAGIMQTQLKNQATLDAATMKSMTPPTQGGTSSEETAAA